MKSKINLNLHHMTITKKHLPLITHTTDGYPVSGLQIVVSPTHGKSIKGIIQIFNTLKTSGYWNVFGEGGINSAQKHNLDLSKIQN